MKGIKLVFGDCLVEMQKIPDKSIDMILCDLPYGTTNNKWDIVINFEDLWEQYKRIIKDNGVIVLFGNQPFTTDLINSNRKMFRYQLIWIKNKFSDFLNANRKPLKINEDVNIFYKKQPTYNPQFSFSEPYERYNKQQSVDKQTNYGKYKCNVTKSEDGRRMPTTALFFDKVIRTIHPTQKPIKLLEYLIKTYTNEGMVVLDNAMGSGSTGVACVNTNRKFIGIELDKNYFKIAIKRINEAFKISRNNL